MLPQKYTSEAFRFDMPRMIFYNIPLIDHLRILKGLNISADIRDQSDEPQNICNATAIDCLWIKKGQGLGKASVDPLFYIIPMLFV
ncbi:hypothetical protein V6N13_038284 [Hibiscus sabdariffa]|uniref:Uncharacterized protein n=1 Tax=Hibiscus sabdariffa TaxID=183260 RepID=A0ABR2S2D3_9ROSI